MKLSDFHRTYANTPLHDRFIVIDKIHHGDMTLKDIYFAIKQYEETARAAYQEIDKLLAIASTVLK